MDAVDDDVSARVLLRNVLHTEPPRSPVTRSKTQDQQASRLRRSSRVRNTAGFESPQVTLRHKLKQKLHETPVLPSKRPRSESKKVKKTPAVASSSLYDEDITTRGLLRGIIQTEAEASLLQSGQPGLLEAEQHHMEPSFHSIRHSEGGSGLELPDLVTEPLSHLIRGMRRRRPPPTFNVSAFERQLDQESGVGEKSDVTEQNTDVTQEQDLSAGSKSVLSLTLKTPFLNVRAERAGLQRKAAGRRQPSVGAFDEAVQKRLERHQNQEYTSIYEGRTLGDSDWQKFTLGLSNVTVPNLTTDIAMSNTELYAHSSVSILKEDERRIPETGTHESEKVCEAETEREDEGEKVMDKHEDNQNEHLNKIAETEPDQKMEDPETDLQSQEEKEENVGAISSSQREEAEVGLSPEEIPFVPTQPMAESLSQTQTVEQESAIEEANVEGMQWGKSGLEGLMNFEHLSPQSERITRRAYRSEGMTIMPGVTTRGRGTKSLGPGIDALEKEVQSFNGGTSSEEFPIVEEDPDPTSASPCGSPSLKPSSPSTHQTSLAEMEDDEDEGITEGNASQSEDINIETSPVHLSTTPQSPAAMEEDQEEDGEEHTHSEELSMQTPSFVRQRKAVATPNALSTPTVLKSSNTNPVPKVKRHYPQQKHQSATDNVLPKSYVMSVFKHFAKTKVASDVYPVINEILHKYFDRLADDLEAYSAHAKRKTIEVEDIELLMRRQGFVTDRTPVSVLIEKFLPLEYRKLLIPVATSGNKVIPNQRR